jgi:hypothetical protein
MDEINEVRSQGIKVDVLGYVGKAVCTCRKRKLSEIVTALKYSGRLISLRTPGPRTVRQLSLLPLRNRCGAATAKAMYRIPPPRAMVDGGVAVAGDSFHEKVTRRSTGQATPGAPAAMMALT